MRKGRLMMALVTATTAVLVISGCTAHGTSTVDTPPKRVVVSGQARLDAKTAVVVGDGRCR